MFARGALHILTCIQACINMHACMHTYSSAYMHTYIQAYVKMHTLKRYFNNPFVRSCITHACMHTCVSGLPDYNVLCNRSLVSAAVGSNICPNIRYCGEPSFPALQHRVTSLTLSYAGLTAQLHAAKTTVESFTADARAVCFCSHT